MVRKCNFGYSFVYDFVQLMGGRSVEIAICHHQIWRGIAYPANQRVAFIIQKLVSSPLHSLQRRSSPILSPV